MELRSCAWRLRVQSFIGGRVRRGCRKRQTLAASPAEPGGLLWLSSCRSDLSGAYVSCSLPCNPKHGPDADAQIPGNTPDTEAAGPCGADRRGLVRVGILEAPPTKLCTLLASTGEAGE